MGMFSRAASLAAVPVKTTAKFAGAAAKTSLGADKDAAFTKATADSVEALTGALSKARGPALKFGQVLALFSSTLPPEQAESLESLTRLYENAHPRPWNKVAGQTASLPKGVSIDPDAIAAASLGQVHRGTWTDGTPVAIKIQYPDAHRIVRADTLQLRTFVPLIHRIMPDLDVKALLDEHVERLWEELDYAREGRWQEKFRTAWNTTYPGIVTIPKVLHADPELLVTEWLDGTPYTQIAGLPEESRNRAGRALSRFILWSPGLLQAVHADPHPGNYRLLPDGTLGVLDFGSIGQPVGEFTHLFAETFKLADTNDMDGLERLWRATGMLAPNTSTDDLLRILDLDLDLYRQPEFTFTRTWMSGRSSGWSDPGSAVSDVNKLAMPPHILLEHRAVGGMLALLCSIEPTVDFRQVLDHVK